jgi:hypothetical protein
MSYSTVPDLITDTLRANSTIQTKCASRIHYQTIPQSSQYPHIYCARQGQFSDGNVDGSRGTITDRFVIEIVARFYDPILCEAVQSALTWDGFQTSGLEVFLSEIEDVNDDYVFKSADSDALFLHGFVVTVYYSNQ